ncbi:ABC transporter permease [Blastococcus sp. CT_GayMR16]|uniref:ABC transporter permease n=1 Tax=Blastococcus sp. CT_GayMR16 TaxID=2559607 RepID=UPI0010737959|nr:ABC transporter permease [Blastococcus sp. CT_GayMR16]TFV87943.1 ABC transporter permease [Blastococcus sp. CT_GayMR16]
MSTARPTLAGTGALVRFALRRDRLRLPLWIALGAGLVASQSVSSQTLYDSPAALVAYRDSVGSNAATIAFAGPPVGLSTVAGAVAFEISASVMLAAALMAMFTTGRHTRADEEAGRTELIRAGRVGRHAPLIAAVLVSALACVAMALAIGLVGTATGLPTGGSFLLGASVGACGLVFTGIAAVAAQVTESTRSAYGIVGAVFGVAFVLRAVGDINGSWLVWASPVGWAQAVHPFSDDRVLPLLLCLVATAGLVAAAMTLLDHRDLGSGLLPARPGPPRAGPLLGSPLGLAIRLQRAALIAWAVSLALLGAVYGGVGDAVETLFADNPQAQVFFPGASSAGLVEAYLATIFSINALLAAAYAVSSVLRARAEESAGRAESVLATATSRGAWLGSHVTVALLGSALLVVLSGAATALVRGLSSGDLGSFGRLFAASLAYVPAVWAVAALAVALVGLAPRIATGAAWGGVAYVVVVAMVAQALDWPGWVGDLSPFAWTPLVPIEAWTLPVAVGLGAVVLVLLAVGFGAFRHRDLSTG